MYAYELRNMYYYVFVCIVFIVCLSLLFFVVGKGLGGEM